nr:vomeronasal type-1 receptor 4-like [Manis javanica]
MTSRDLTIGMIFLSQTAVGILGNFSLLCHYLSFHFTGCRVRSTDLILKHLTIANLLAILSKGIPQTMAALGVEDFLNDTGCKLVFYVHRVSRDVSLGTTCLLNIFQAIMISPRTSRCAELAVKAPKFIGTSIIFCWVLNMTVNIIVLVYVAGKDGITDKNDYGYCSAALHEKTVGTLYVTLVLFHDGFCLVLILWASGSTVFILLGHKQQVQHIYRNHVSPRSSPETRATQSILVLASTFVCLCTVSSILHVCLATLRNPSWWLVNLSALIAAGFPTVSPYVLMSHDPTVSRPCFAWIRNTKSPKHIININSMCIHTG